MHPAGILNKGRGWQGELWWKNNHKHAIWLKIIHLSEADPKECLRFRRGKSELGTVKGGDYGVDQKWNSRIESSSRAIDDAGLRIMDEMFNQQ